MVTVGLLRSGKTSTGSRLALKIPSSTRTAEAASTIRRLRSDCVTRKRNIGRSPHVAYLAEQLGALDDEALAGGEPGGDEDAIAVERLDPHRTRLEAFRRDMLVDDILAVGVAHQGGARNREAGLFLVGGGEHGDELPGAKPRDVALHRELHRDRLIAAGEAGAAEGERIAPVVVEPGHRAMDAGKRVEAQRLYPQPVRVDDMEDDGVGLGHLPGDDGAFGNDAVDRRDQFFRIAARPVERAAPVLQALQLGPCVLQLGARNGAARHQGFVTRQPALHDGNLLVEFTLPLAHIGGVDGLQRRRHIGEHIAFPDRCPQPRKAARRRRKPAADRRLNKSAGVRIGDGAARQFQRAAMRGGFDPDGLDGENSLDALGHEYAAIGQPLRKVAHRRIRRPRRVMIVTVMGARCAAEGGEHPGDDEDHRGPAASPHHGHDDNSRGKTSESRDQGRRDIAG